MPDTLTLCGGCGHPMHWKECGANPDSTGGPCRCDNSISVEVSPTMPDTPLDAAAATKFYRSLHKRHPVRCTCGHAFSSHRQDPVDVWATERCKTCGCAGFQNRDEPMQSEEPHDA
jgi:hypothetical protein